MKRLIVLRALVLLALLVGVPSCAEERDAISRVQPDALAKSFFVGKLDDPDDDPEFYFRSTVVDVAAGAGADGLFTNSDAQPTSRIRWDITEELLLARLTYERIDDTDGKGVRRVADGQIVAAYRIQSHFDIKRDYNPETGEDLNIVVENDTDRPWYRRSHFRVDWSRNLTTSAYELDTLAQLGIYYGVQWEPIAYYVNEPGHPHAPVFDQKRGYFDITHKVWAKPGIISDELWGDFPACWLYGRFPSENCNPSELTLRQAFLRVTDSDYEPLEYDGAKMELFGYFTVDRFGYDRSYGVVDDKWRRFATRWNLFEQSHTEARCNTPETTPAGADPRRDDNGNGTHDECEIVGFGSRCDAARGQCTLPYRARPVRTIAWHAGPGFPEELFEGTREAFSAWSDSLRVAVLAARIAECRRTGEGSCETQMGLPTPWRDDHTPPLGSSSPAEVPEIFVFCHNPVSAAAGDPPACGADGTAPRLGDLRFNMVSILQEPQLMAPWGIMMDAEDPLTGEKIAGSLTQWGAVLDQAAANLTDLVSLLEGLIEPEAFIAGQDVSHWVEQNQAGGAAERGHAMSGDELTERLGALDSKVLDQLLAGLPKGQKHKLPAARRKAREQALSASGRLGPGNAALSERLGRLRGSAIESRLVTPDLMQAAGFDPTGPVSQDAVRRASPAGRMNPTVRREAERARRLSDAKRHACRFEGPEPDHLLGLARALSKKFPLPDPSDAAAVASHREQLLLFARQELSRGVMAHEIGHSVGLRHNFAASYDALNYAPEYWQLRTGHGAVTASCPPGTTDGSACIGPRWRDPISDGEIDGNIGRWATSSVMDYPGDPNQDMTLPGKYDRAAVRFGYGGTVDVWAEPGVSVTGTGAGQAEAYELSAFATNPGLFGVYYFPAVDPEDGYRFRHYSEWPARFRLIEDCQDDAGAPLGKRCRERAMDLVSAEQMQDFASDPDYAGFAWALTPLGVDGQGRVRRGYLFSSDEYADTGNVPAFSLDAGADAYEQIRFLESAYENRYLLDSFRRGRVAFNSFDTMVRIQSRYLDKIQLIAKTFAFGAVLDGDPGAPTADLLQDGLYGPHALGSTVALDLFARIVTRPEPGHYCPADVCGSGRPPGIAPELFSADAVALPDVFLYDFSLPLGVGRYLHNDYDYAQGYWWSDYQTQVGTYYDKIWATYYLAEAFDSFVASSKEDFVDSRYKNVSFATVFPEQVRRLYTQLLTGDLAVYAPHALAPSSPTGTPLGSLTFPTWSSAAGLGARPSGAFLVEPNHGFNEQLYAMVWGATFFPTNWSNAWVHEARIAALPAEVPEWPADEIVAFSYPVSGVTYRARSYGLESLFGQSVERAAGARMLQWANRLVSLAYEVERDASDERIFLPDGRPVFVLDAAGKPVLDPTGAAAAAALVKYVDQIDLMRQVSATFAMPIGPGDLPEP